MHTLLPVSIARLFLFDLHFSDLFRSNRLLCGIASLSHSGDVVAAPLLAARYCRSLVPACILPALPGYTLGTGSHSW